MYGLVNRAIQDLVVNTAGSEVWEEIKREADIAELDFLDGSDYDDKITFDLVAAVSKKLGEPAETILRAFGRHWILYTGREGWNTLFDLGGDNMKEFLHGLDEMHARVQIAMPNSRMPQFTVVEEADHLILEYHSYRDGLAHMVLGLLDGLAEQFDEKWDFEYISTRQDHGFDTFKLRRVQAASSDDITDEAA